MIKPGRNFPSVCFKDINGGQYRLPELGGEKILILVVYRGFHCGVCKSYLETLATQLADFASIGVDVIAVSSDTRAKAECAQNEWQLGEMMLGYDLDLEAGRQLGLFLSKARKKVEPEQFFEPGLYVITPDAKLLFVSIQNMPFGRTQTSELLTWIPKVVDLGIPPRGTADYSDVLPQESDLKSLEGQS